MGDIESTDIRLQCAKLAAEIIRDKLIATPDANERKKISAGLMPLARRLYRFISEG